MRRPLDSRRVGQSRTAKSGERKGSLAHCEYNRRVALWKKVLCTQGVRRLFEAEEEVIECQHDA